MENLKFIEELEDVCSYSGLPSPLAYEEIEENIEENIE